MSSQINREIQNNSGVISKYLTSNLNTANLKQTSALYLPTLHMNLLINTQNKIVDWVNIKDTDRTIFHKLSKILEYIPIASFHN